MYKLELNTCGGNFQVVITPEFQESQWGIKYIYENERGTISQVYLPWHRISRLLVTELPSRNSSA